ncbi:MAG: hypothetical protein PHS73_03810 [Candidatus Peribacteraceae bacterium]|nr:hypothetical protein [Candidatus Peribacteraceae bacterium]
MGKDKDAPSGPDITHHEEFDTPDGQDLNVVTHWADGTELQQFRKGMGSMALAAAGIAPQEKAA